MKKFGRVLSFLLAVVLFVYDIPLSRNAFAAEDGQTADSLVDLDTAMKFEQKSFDPSTGILTMSLKIKTSEPGWIDVVDYGAFQQEYYKGTYVSEGFLAFQTDSSSITPITVNAEQVGEETKITKKDEIASTGQTVAFVANTEIKGGNAITDFANEKDQRGYQVGSGTFNKRMNTFQYVESGDFREDHSGLFVSAARVRETRMLDCYFQFRFEQDVRALPGEDGYVNVADLYFQCYSGRDENGQPTPATKEDALFSQSIVIPGTKEEAAALTGQFYTVKNKPDSETLAMGAAGYREKYYEGGSISELVMGGAYYYYAAPRLTEWRGKGTEWDELPDHTLLEGAPGYRYAHMDDNYVVTDFRVANANTHSTDRTEDDKPITDPDFYVPPTETVAYPRYRVPTKPESDANDAGGNWVPVSYSVDSGKEKPTLMSYAFATEVTDNSVSSPESEDINGFLDRVQWEFKFEDGTLLNACQKEEIEGSGRTVQTSNGPVYVVEAYITDESSHYYGKGPNGSNCKVQNVYEDVGGSPGAYLMTTPVGVLLEMHNDSPIRYMERVYDPDLGEWKKVMKTSTGRAPQLHISNDAADAGSYLWTRSELYQTGQVFLAATYQDPSGGRFSSQVITTKLYKDASAATSVELDTDDVGTVTEDEDQVLGYTVGVPTPDNDRVTEGIPVRSVVYDQYYQVMEGAQSTLEIRPDSATAAKINAAKKSNAFQIQQDETDPSVYYIKYAAGKTVNDVVEGTYLLKASYGSLPAQEEALRVLKAEDYLAYMSVAPSLSGRSEVDGDVEVIRYTVPAMKEGVVQKQSITLRINELANQWRPDRYVEDISQYDIVPNIRTGNYIDMKKVWNSPVTVTFEPEFGEAMDPRYDYESFNITGLVGTETSPPTGTFTFDSTTVKDAVLHLTVRASYQGIEIVKKYKFIFEHNDPYLAKIEVQQPKDLLVPTLSEYTNNGPATQSVVVIARDQYNQSYAWSSVEQDYNATDGRLNPEHKPLTPWKLEIVGEKPKGVNLEGDRGTTITVSPDADSVTFKVRAVFGFTENPFTSNEVEVVVRREDSKPFSVEEINYGITEITSPAKGSQALSYRPTLRIIDQYGTNMQAGDYTMKWVLRSPQDRPEQVHLQEKDPVTGKKGEETGTIVVEPCAENCNITLMLFVYDKNGKSPLSPVTYTELKVRRAAAQVSAVQVATDSIKYPAVTDEVTGGLELKATGATQYGDDQALSNSEVTWTLNSVTLGSETGGEVLTYDPVSGGEITLSGGVYTGGSLSVNSLTGAVGFTTVTDADKVPVSFEVTAQYKTTISEKKKITIPRPNPVPYEIYVPMTSYKNGIDVPDRETGTNKLKLDGYIRDQYTVDLDGEIVWKITDIFPEQEEGSIELKQNVLEVHTNATKCSVEIEASAGTAAPTTITVDVDKGEGTPHEITILPVQQVGENGSVKPLEGTEIALPGDTEKPGVYNLRARVWDEFGYAMGSETVRWELAEVPKAQVKLDALSGKLTVAYSEAARDSGNGESTIRVRAVSQTDDSVSQILEITVKKQEAKAAYAVPQAVITDPDRITGTGEALVPKRGETPTTVKYSATIYSQYREAMSAEGAGDAAFELKTKAEGLRFDPEQAELYIDSSMGGTVVTVSAAPKVNPEGKDAVSECKLYLNRGASYPYELILGSNSQGDDNLKNIDVPPWSTVSVANAPSEENFETYEFSARVVDQYYLGIADPNTYPVWQFAEEYDSVEFSGMGPGETTVSGEKVRIRVGANALKPGETSKKIKVNLWTSTEEQTGAYVKTLTFTLHRKAPSVSYLYFEGVDADGTAKEPFQRPYANDVSQVRNIRPVVYDQYGFALEDAETQLDLVTAPLVSAGYEVRKTYGKGQKEENGDIPEQYSIWKLPPVEEDPVVKKAAAGAAPEAVLMAEFSTVTGELKLYSTCVLDELRFTAHCAALGLTKTMTLPISEEVRAAHSVAIVREQNGPYIMRKGSQENFTEHIYAVVYDQYGEGYGLPTVNTIWSLKTRDEAGNLVDYKEYEEDGTPKMDNDYLVLKADGTQRDTTLTIQSEQFVRNTSVYLQCDLQRKGSTGLLGITSVSEVAMRTNSGAGSEITVYFEAGEYGKLVGVPVQNVDAGGVPAEVPGIKTLEGYGFFGWTSDGYTLVDPAQVPVYESLVYYAVYRNITDTQFLDGYSDKTIRPEQKVTRAEFVKMIVEAEGGFDDKVTYRSSFTDVAPEKWYAKYIGYAQSKNLVQGYPDGTFRPNAKITRAEAAKMLALAMGGEALEEPVSFPDVGESKWYTPYVEMLAAAKVIGGYPDGTFRPENDIVRSEAIKMVVSITVNALNDLARKNIEEYGYCPFVDIKKGYWAYAYILRAAGIA